MQNIIAYFMNLPLLELIAVCLSFIYILLAAKGNSWCWPAAFISTALYTYIFYDVALLMDSMLNIYYMVMAIYGWFNWHKNKISDEQSIKTLDICHWSWRFHTKILVFLALLSLALGYFMANYTIAAFPYTDTATTVFSVFATYLVAKKVLENWLYWVVIDVISIYLYIEKSLQPTAVLFGFYVVLSIYGYWQWYQQLKVQEVDAKSDNVKAESTMVQI
jgi:nicotinamide mononucleotide transporter